MSLDELKLRIKDAPLTEIIGRYLPLTRQGTNVLAVCPFHDDHKPSMHVNDQKKMWMCFVDNMGGDAINFVMRYKSLNYIDALKDICQQLGWNFDDYHQEGKVSPKYSMGKKVLSITTQIYRKLALSNQYDVFSDFLSKRKIESETAKTYELGFASNTNPISQYLLTISNPQDQKMALEAALELGVIKEDQYREGSHYDTFRDRIIFPIWDQFGQVIGFTTRATRDDQKAKYMNSKESFLFNKKQLLYGFHLAQSHIRERDSLILCEGNMDQLSLYSNGFENSVAIMGIALGEQAMKRVLQLTKKVLLALDNDDAGFRAMERINQQFMAHGVLPSLVDLSPHKDPDDFIQEAGPLALKERIDQAKPFIDILIAKKVPETIPQGTDQKISILKDASSLLSPLGESLIATERIIQLAKNLGLQSDPAQILKTYQQELSTQNQRPSTSPRDNDTPKKFPSAPKVEKIEYTKELSKTDQLILQEVIAHPEILTHHEFRGLLDFVDRDEVKRYVLKLSDIVYEIDEKEFSTLLLMFNSHEDVSLEIRETTGAALYRYTPNNLNDKVIDKMLLDLKKRLEIEQLRSKRESLVQSKKNETIDANREKILSEIIQVDQQLNQLKAKKNIPTL